MAQRKIHMSIVIWFVLLMCIGTIFVIWFGVIYNRINQRSIPGDIIVAILVAVTGIPYCIFLLRNSNIVIKDNIIVFPQQYHVGATSFYGIEPFIALFRKKVEVDINKIRSADINLKFEYSARYVNRQFALKMISGQAITLNMLYFSNRDIGKILRAMIEQNKGIELSDTCKEVLNLKGLRLATTTEWKTAKPTLITLGIISVLMAALITFVALSVEQKTEVLDISSAGIVEDLERGPALRLETQQGVTMNVHIRQSYKGTIDRMIADINRNNNLKNDAQMIYNSRFYGLFRNLINVTLSNGQTYNVGDG